MKKGFTLVEILIVVIILGILAAIVIPQFTNASEDARKSSLTSQLQTVRTQVELYKLQHRDQYPTADGTVSGTWDWSKMTSQTDDAGVAYSATDSTSGPFGPYLQSTPKNSISATGASGMAVATDEFDSLEGVEWSYGADNGWVITPTGKIYAANKGGTYLYNENKPSDTNNTGAAAAE
jgi:general secretion pathway protein G